MIKVLWIVLWYYKLVKCFLRRADSTWVIFTQLTSSSMLDCFTSLTSIESFTSFTGFTKFTSLECGVLNWSHTISSVARVERKSVRFVLFGINEMIQSSSQPSPATTTTSSQQQQQQQQQQPMCHKKFGCWPVLLMPIGSERKSFEELNLQLLTKKCLKVFHKCFNSVKMFRNWWKEKTS